MILRLFIMILFKMRTIVFFFTFPFFLGYSQAEPRLDFYCYLSVGILSRYSTSWYLFCLGSCITTGVSHMFYHRSCPSMQLGLLTNTGQGGRERRDDADADAARWMSVAEIGGAGGSCDRSA